MQTKSEQVALIGSWIDSQDKWTSILNTNGDPALGSRGANVIIGYLPTYFGNENDITVIYKCLLRVAGEKSGERYQLSSLGFSDWLGSMKKINA